MSTLFHTPLHLRSALTFSCLGLLAVVVVWFFASRSTPVRLNPPSHLRTFGLRFRCGVNDIVLSFEQMQALNRWDPKRTASNPPNPKAAAPSP